MADQRVRFIGFPGSWCLAIRQECRLTRKGTPIPYSVRLQRNRLIGWNRFDLVIPSDRPDKDHVVHHDFWHRKQIAARQQQMLFAGCQELPKKERTGRRPSA